MAAKKRTRAPDPPERIQDDGVHCCWGYPEQCASLASPSYLERPLCDPHFNLAMNATYDGSYFPSQLVSELLQIPLTKEERAMVQTMAYSERETKIKGMPCTECGRNVPDARPDTVVKVWCWECVLTGRFRGETLAARRKPAPDVEQTTEAAEERREAAPRGSGDREVVRQSLVDISAGAKSYEYQGGKVKSVFTKGKTPNSVSVQDNHGITTYDLKDEVHYRIVFNRILRWMKKGEPAKLSDGVVALKGPKLAVKIGGTRGGD